MELQFGAAFGVVAKITSSHWLNAVPSVVALRIYSLLLTSFSTCVHVSVEKESINFASTEHVKRGGWSAEEGLLQPAKLRASALSSRSKHRRRKCGNGGAIETFQRSVTRGGGCALRGLFCSK